MEEKMWTGELRGAPAPDVMRLPLWDSAELRVFCLLVGYETTLALLMRSVSQDCSP